MGRARLQSGFVLRKETVSSWWERKPTAMPPAGRVRPSGSTGLPASPFSLGSAALSLSPMQKPERELAGLFTSACLHWVPKLL